MMDSQFMEEALQLGLQAVDKGDGGPFGCVIVKDGVVVGRGWNQVLLHQDPTAHAEVVAIRDACKQLGAFQLEDCDVYTSCEPCPMCLGAIYWARPRQVFYASSRYEAADAGFDDSFIYEEMNRSEQERSIPLVHVPQPEAAALFRRWNERSNLPRY